MYPLVGSHQGHLQNRGFGESGTVMGQAQKSAGHELRQVEQIDQTVLQKGNYEKDGTIATSRLSVLPPLQSVRWWIGE